MSPEYPNPCCRCGFCCLSETCPMGQLHYDIGKMILCPGLSFQDGEAICELALTEPEIFGIGAGCCIKARAIKDGVTYDFASLHQNLKRSIARKLA